MPAEGALDEAAPADPWARRMQRHNHRSQLRGQVPRPTPAHATRTSPRASPRHHPRFSVGARGREKSIFEEPGQWRSEAPAGWGCPAWLLWSSQPVSSQPCVSRPERQVTPPTPAVTRALADNGTISRSTSAPETPCHRPGTCATPARAGEQWMRGSGARSSGCSGAAPAHWHCVDLAALDNCARCSNSVWPAEP